MVSWGGGWQKVRGSNRGIELLYYPWDPPARSLTINFLLVVGPGHALQRPPLLALSLKETMERRSVWGRSMTTKLMAVFVAHAPADVEDGHEVPRPERSCPWPLAAPAQRLLVVVRHQPHSFTRPCLHHNRWFISSWIMHDELWMHQLMMIISTSWWWWNCRSKFISFQTIQAMGGSAVPAGRPGQLINIWLMNKWARGKGLYYLLCKFMVHSSIY
jgi:hypothetical protein